MFKKADLKLILSIIILSFILMMVIYLIPFEGEPYVSIYINGDKVDSYPLDGEYREIPIETVLGYNLLIISDGMAFIKEADCHTRSCISSRVISRPGSMIICAPHNLVVKIDTLEEGGVQ